jgi:hypothetical protein
VIRDHAALLEQLSERWRNLEFRIKDAEQITGTVTIPAVNELRYTGRRFFEAWLIAAKGTRTEKDIADFHDHIRVAQQYFNNADHDLTDALISFFAERRRHFQAKYGLIRGTQMYPTLVAWMGKIDEAQAIIRESRANRHDRMNNYQRLEKELLPGLISRYREIVLSEISYVRRYRIARFARVVGVLFTIVVGIAELIIAYDLLARWLTHLIHGCARPGAHYVYTTSMTTVHRWLAGPRFRPYL